MLRFVFLCFFIVHQVMIEAECDHRWFKCLSSNNTMPINCAAEKNEGWIPISKQCNGAKDCADGSDESLVTCKLHPLLQRPHVFYCASGGAVSEKQSCDRKPDCLDKSDELNCNYISNAPRGVCGEKEMECLPGECISLEKLCDHQVDCSNGLDESLYQCFEECGEGQFQCGYGSCIHDSLLCDNKPDCLDGADELFNVCEDMNTNYKPEPYRNCTEPSEEFEPKFDVDTKYLLSQKGQKYLWPNEPVHFKCPTNRWLIGLSWNVCQLNGTWHHALPKCR